MKPKSHRSGMRIMASLVVLLGSLSYIMVFAVLNGVAGYVCAMGVSVFGALSIAKFAGVSVALSYGWIIGLAIGCGVLRGLLRYGEQYCNHYIAFRLLALLRDKIFGALRVLCPAKLESKQKGSIIAMITSDIEVLEVFYAHTVSPVCIAFLMSSGVFLFVGFTVSWYLAAVALVGYVVIGVVLPPLNSRRLRASGIRYRTEFASFNAYFLDSIKGVKDIVFNNAEKSRASEVSRRSEELLRDTRKMKREITKSTALTELFVTVFVLLTVAVGIVLVRFDVVSTGKMILGVTTVFGSFGPVIALSALPGNLTHTFAAGDRVLDLLVEKPVVCDVRGGKDIEFDNLEVKDLDFSYDGSVRVLDGVNFRVGKGEIVGLVGESGCGKSTLLKLLLRFWERDGGVINCNGTDIDAINSESLLQNVTLVSQNTWLFDESIEDNLRIAKPDATREELEKACKSASVHDFILSLPDGYATRVGTMGDNLSAGEKQRLGLARAFLRGSGLILLDEPTSNVDSINEGIILKSLAEQKGNKSIILVSHRESTMAIADRIYRVENGVVTEAKS